MNDADEFRTGIFQQFDFYQILWGQYLLGDQVLFWK